MSFWGKLFGVKRGKAVGSSPERDQAQRVPSASINKVQEATPKKRSVKSAAPVEQQVNSQSGESLSVNLSPKEFANKSLQPSLVTVPVKFSEVPSFIDAIEEVLKKTGAEPDDAYDQASRGLAVECEKCGLLDLDAVAAIYFVTTPIGKATLNAQSTAAYQRCRFCGGTTAEIWFVPHAVKAMLSSQLLPTIVAHLKKIESQGVGTYPDLPMVVNDVDVGLTARSTSIAAVVLATRYDGRFHHVPIMVNNSATWVIVTSVPAPIRGASAEFAKFYPPGYGGHINRWINSAISKSAIQKGRCNLANVLIYQEGAVGLGVIPFDPKNPNFFRGVIFPEECLTQEDKRLLKR